MMTMSSPDSLNPLPMPPPDGARKKSSVAPRSIRGRIVAGVLLIIPLAVTAFLLSFVYNQALSVGVRLINWFSRAVLWAFDVAVVPTTGPVTGDGPWYQNIVASLAEAAKDPPSLDPSTASWYQNLLAVVLTVVMLYMLGWLGTNVAGRRIINLFESLMERIPLVDTIYPAMKRMVQALSGAGKPGEEKQRVILVDFPTQDVKAIALVTNRFTNSISGEEFVTAFVPTTPNPTSGYMLIVPMNRVTYTDWGMEEAMSMILSGGASARHTARFADQPDKLRGPDSRG